MLEPSSNVQPEPDKKAILDQLLPALRALGVTKITGSRLAPLIDSALPPNTSYRLFVQSHKHPNLRTFVEQYLAGVVEPSNERSGTDPIYIIVDAPAATAGEIRTHGMLWKTFVAISPSRQLFFDRKTSELNIRDISASESSDTPAVASVSIQEHETMRGEFVVQVLDKNGSTTPELKALLDCAVAYHIWIARLRSTKPRLDRDWQEFRRDAILRLFEMRLTDLEVSGERVAELKIQLTRDLEQTRVGKLEQEVSIATTVGVTLPIGLTKDSKEKHARELLHAAVDRMTMEQMQNLQIPFSLVLELVKPSSAQ